MWSRDSSLRGFALTLLLVASIGFAQEEPEAAEEAGESGTEAAAETEEETAEDADDLLDLEDPDLDVQGFDPTADDDFVPSEEIPADAPIDFPTDI